MTMSEILQQKNKLRMKNSCQKTHENITLHTELISSKFKYADSHRSTKWMHVSIMCLLEILYEEYDRSKSSPPVTQRKIFEKASREMKRNGFFFSKEELRQKYKSLIAQYRNIKAKSFDTEDNHSWPYFEIISEVYKKEKSFPRNFKSLKRCESKKLPVDTKKLNSTKNFTKPNLANLASRTEGTFICTSNDLAAFTTQWEAKQFATEDHKLKLLQSLFEDLNTQRTEVEQDTLIHIKMRSEKLKYLKRIISEMNEFRVNLKTEFSSLVELINNLIMVLKDADQNS